MRSNARPVHEQDAERDIDALIRFRASMSATVTELAAWRRRRGRDHPDDARHHRSAAALEELATFIAQIDPQHPAVVSLHRLCSVHDVFTPGQQTSLELGRYHFFQTTTSHEAFLSYLVDVASRDAAEGGRFGGPQVPGDDPWQ